MKIAFVLDDTLDSTDGVQQYVLSLGGFLSKQGHDVHYIVGATKRKDIHNIHSVSKNIKVTFNKNKMSTPLPARKQAIKRLFKIHNFDVVHVQMPFSPLMASRVIAVAKKRHVPVVATFHILPATAIEAVGLKLLAVAQRNTLRKIDAYLAVSSPARDCLEQYFALQSTVIPNPVNTKVYASKKLIKHTPGSIVFVGRLVPRKGCRELLEAIAWLKKHDLLPRETTVTICGDGSLRAQLDTFVKLHGLKDIVTFMGRVSEDEKIKQLRHAELAIFPSLGGESFGIVLIEAMAAGAQVVLAGDNPGYRSVMNNNEQVLVDPKNTEVFAAQIRHFLTTASARQSMHAWQQAHVEQYDIQKVGAEIEQLYQSLIAKKTNHQHNSDI